MRQSHQITLILPDGMCLEEFFTIMSGALESSNFEYTVDSYHPDGVKTETVNSKEYNLEPIDGRDIVMEFKKKDL